MPHLLFCQDHFPTSTLNQYLYTHTGRCLPMHARVVLCRRNAFRQGFEISYHSVESTIFATCQQGPEKTKPHAVVAASSTRSRPGGWDNPVNTGAATMQQTCISRAAHAEQMRSRCIHLPTFRLWRFTTAQTWFEGCMSHSFDKPIFFSFFVGLILPKPVFSRLLFH